MSLHSEIYEQPSCLRQLLGAQRATVEEIARVMRAKSIPFAFIAARGTSENASRYAKYLWGAMNGLPVALAAPSLFTYYNSPPLLHGALVVGISQSGMSPDVVSVLTEGKRQGCLTLAITNSTHSPLAKTADFILNIEAGEENAVAATKTYSAELMAVAMLSAAINQDETLWHELSLIPDRMSAVLREEDDLEATVTRYRSISSCVILGRGFNYSTAYEWALKLKELTYVEAQPYSSADFVHGPIAMVDGRFPILAVVPEGAVSASVLEVLTKLQQNGSDELVVISDVEEALTLAKIKLRLPEGVPEWLSPLVSIVPAQRFCYHLAVARGCDTESPRGIHKVTETR
jgi:glucosamine--fructose-6-phosphate aminotransferase (isomerizing)